MGFAGVGVQVGESKPQQNLYPHHRYRGMSDLIIFNFFIQIYIYYILLVNLKPEKFVTNYYASTQNCLFLDNFHMAKVITSNLQPHLSKPIPLAGGMDNQDKLRLGYG